LTSPLLPLSIQRFVNGTSGAIEHGDEVRIDRLSRISRPSAGLWNSVDRRCSSSIVAAKVKRLVLADRLFIDSYDMPVSVPNLLVNGGSDDD
jgi:hypothetical protein